MFDRFRIASRQILASLEYVTILLFVSAALPGVAKRHRLRRAAVVVYAIALFLAVSLVVLWWAGVDFLL